MPPGMVCVFSSLFSILCCCVVTQSSASSSHHPTFLRNDTFFEHLALHPDPKLGRVYLGARDRLYQLSFDLQLEAEEETGPVIDSRDCLPPISDTNCPQAKWTNNHNKLLLVDPYSQELISCGSVYQGICQKRSLDSVGKVLFSAERPVDTQYVAANDPNVSTVGLVALTRGRGKQQPVLFVGRGYTNSQPPISTRNLVMEPVFSYEETSKLAVAGRLSEYDHHFVTSFTHRSYVYFMFYRRDLQSPSREYRTYVSRMCLDDTAYYSYVEVPLSCRSAGGKNYNLLQALHVGLPKSDKVLGKESTVASEEVLLGVFSSHFASSSRPNEESAVCVFSLEQVDKRISATRDLCYTEMGRADGQEVAYIEYEVKSNCANLPANTLDAYPCGSDHTPSPMASRVLVEAEPIFDSPSVRLTAVAVSVREEHTIAFLGDSQGNLHKVFLGPKGEVEEYAVISIHPSAPISRELRLDHQENHLYILTSNMLEKRPVAECEKHLDCQSCLLAHDPYCGWCVLEGKCGLRSECVRGDQKDQWLWSFDIEQQCLSVTFLNPSNISREERRIISLSIPGLPSLEQGEHYSCVFQDRSSLAVVTESGVTCSSPHVHTLPYVSPGQDFFTVTLSLRFRDVVVTSREFTFYDCTAVKQLAGSMPCHGCVQSRWGCNWCVNQHMCTHKAVCDKGLMIYNEHWKSLPTLPPATKASGAAFTTSPVTTHKVPETTAHTKPSTTATAITETITTVLESLTSSAPVKPTSSTKISSTSAAPTSAFLPSSTAETTVQPASTLSLLDEILSEKELLVTDIESVALRETDTDVVTLASLAVVVKTELPSDIEAAEEQRISLSSSSAETELPPLMEPATHDSLLTSTPHNLAETLNLMNETQTTVLPSNPEPNVSDSETSDFLPMSERVSPAVPSENKIITDRQEAQLAPEETEEVDQVENDNATFSAATVLSGDGESDSDPPVYLHLGSTGIDADYQYDSTDLQADEGTFVNWGASACPCVEKIQGSSLLPVLTQRKISLLARNLHLYQDKELAYECVMVIEGQTVVVDADVTLNEANPLLFDITCHAHQYFYADSVREYNAMVYVKRKDTFHIDSTDLYVTLYNCSVGHLDCSRCHTADKKYNCVWCGASCVYRESCSQHIEMTCPAPLIHLVEPLSGLVEGGITLTVSGSNLGQKAQDILQSVTVAGVPCTVIPHLYEISSRILCTTTASGEEKSGHISVKVSGGGFGLSSQRFNFQDPKLIEVSPQRGPKAGGTTLTITGRKLLTGRVTDISVLLGNVPCSLIASVQEETIKCLTGASNRTGEHRVTVRYGNTERHLHGDGYYYTPDPNITHAIPSKSFVGGGRVISVFGQNLDVVQKPQMRVKVVLPDSIFPLRRRRRRRKRSVTDVEMQATDCTDCFIIQEDCEVKTSSLLLCRTPGVDAKVVGGHMLVEFLLDNLRFDFNSVSQSPFIYEPNPILHPLNHRDPTKPYRYKPGSVISVEGENLDLAIFKEEVVALIGEGVCTVKTLTHNHLYCEPPSQQPPLSLRHGRKREGTEAFPEFIVHMGNLNFSLGQVQYDSPSHSIFPLVAQIGVGTVASLVALIVLIIVFIYRRKSKQALRDYKKVQIQLENLETSVRDRCKKEFTDLMTEMMDMTSDLVGSGIPFLEYRRYAERIFFPGHRESPLRRDLDVQECRRATVEQGLNQLSNLLNSKLFLTKFIHTLESQRTFSPRDRGYVASLLTVALHSKLEYFTDILKTLLNDLVEQYIAKNPKLMLRRTETVVEKLLTNWISICLYAFLRHSAGEPLYMLFRAIKHQVDKGPVDAVTGKAKYTLNDNRLLREDLEYHTLTLNVLMQGIGVNETQPVAAKVLDCDTITQVKEKILDQVYKGTSYSNRPHADSVDLEWRSGVAGHLILSDEDLTSVVQGNWKRLNTLQHYKVPDGATVALVLRHSKHIHHDTHDYIAGEKTPMLEDADEEGVRLWHLVKASEEPELPKHRRGSLKERERAKTIPEIYLTRLLSMKGTLQKFVDDLFTVILSTSQPVPLAIKYFFDLLDDQAVRHGISDSETIHIWKTNSLPLRFWINIVKNPQFIFDVQVSDNVDAVLSVIAQTFMDSCTTTEHKLGRDSPINKLLYARDIPRYKQMVERYYADIKQTISASDQDMNSALAELSRNYSGELNYLVALHELYKYINKYYDQIITALEEDTTAQKMQLGYRLQQIAAAVENKVTDL
ncbi:plexin-B1 [Cyprinus carpio]|uniref:Plexin-B1 n=2 Tax=Cyprinus carpio TaxID=7962 RepID=A0A9R0AX52_CYPCA|nr:plexin-B1 [Cyprinus carpio]XP_042614017.1 plexin-B1 [Cyprinus carpio]XP_042614018.1 plexin-B1 [Cyprinus carpio]